VKAKGRVSREERLRRIYTYRAHERRALERLPETARVLDLGCSRGANLPALLDSGRQVFGTDVAISDLPHAGRICPVTAGAGERLPFRADAFDLVYTSHVLHHADWAVVLPEVRRVLRPGGVLFVIESFENHPLMRLARSIYPRWGRYPVTSRFRFEELLAALHGLGFRIQTSEQFNLLYWIWEVPQLWLRPMGLLLPLVVPLELAAARRWRRFAAHGFVVAEKPPS
jgi:SAM-dependent methyltransferase